MCSNALNFEAMRPTGARKHDEKKTRWIKEGWMKQRHYRKASSDTRERERSKSRKGIVMLKKLSVLKEKEIV